MFVFVAVTSSRKPNVTMFINVKEFAEANLEMPMPPNCFRFSAVLWRWYVLKIGTLPSLDSLASLCGVSAPEEDQKWLGVRSPFCGAKVGCVSFCL